MEHPGWQRARLAAAAIALLSGLLALGLHVAPLPPPVELSTPPPRPPTAAAPGTDLVAADQARGMRALDRILEDRMRLEAEARGVEPVLPAPELRAMAGDEELLVAWGEAFRAIGVDDLGELTSSPAP